MYFEWGLGWGVLTTKEVSFWLFGPLKYRFWCFAFWEISCWAFLLASRHIPATDFQCRMRIESHVIIRFKPSTLSEA